MKERFHSQKLKRYINEKTFRFKHILGVVEEMKMLLEKVEMGEHIKEELIEAAYLHDIGYSEKLLKTGYHPLDGALYCIKENYSSGIIAAVMFHSGALEDVKRNFPDLLDIYLKHYSKLNEKDQLYIDLVTYCDLHRSSLGIKVTFEERMNEIFQRYGEDHNVSLTMKNNEKMFKELIERVENFVLENKKKGDCL